MDRLGAAPDRVDGKCVPLRSSSVLLAVERLPVNGYVIFIGEGLVSKAAFPTFL